MNKKSLIIIIIEVIFIAILYFSLNYINLIPECWIYKATGLMCPACGGTRCVSNFLQGNFKAAFSYHIVFFIAIVYLIIFNIVYLINLNKKRKIALWVYPKYWYFIILAIVLIIYSIIRNI